MPPAPAPRRSGAAGGVFVAIGALAGAFIGNLEGQASAGLLIGLGVGAVIAVIIWWRS